MISVKYIGLYLKNLRLFLNNIIILHFRKNKYFRFETITSAIFVSHWSQNRPNQIKTVTTKYKT